MIVEREWNPEIVIGILRGGLIPAAVLADLLGLDIEAMRAKFYKGVDDRERKPRIVQDISIDLYGVKVLLVDDVTDSGKTIGLVKEHLLGKGAKEVVLCSLYYKPWSVTIPDVYVEETEAWIIFPWERMETLKDITEKLSVEGLRDEEIKESMLSRGIPGDLIDEFYTNFIQSTE
jgi:hypoxanthine phosphoribosyltransferase